MKRKNSLLIIAPAFCFLFFDSCAGSSVSSVTGTLQTNIRITLAPSGGVLADAIGVELFNRSFTIFDTNQMSNLLLRLNLSEMELFTPKSLQLLKEQGIDAILNVKSVAGYDGLPQSASVRINNTSTGEILSGLSWQNGWGGQAGSMADRTMRKDIVDAAKEIVSNLVRNK